MMQSSPPSAVKNRKVKTELRLKILDNRNSNPITSEEEIEKENGKRSAPIKRWQTAVRMVLGENSIQSEKLDDSKLLGRASSFVFVKGDTRVDQETKGGLIILGLAYSIALIIIKLLLDFKDQIYGISSTIIFEIASVFALGQFYHTKSTPIYSKKLLYLLFIYPLLIQVIQGKETQNTYISVWSFLAPFVALIFESRCAKKWMISFVIGQIVSLGFNFQIIMDGSDLFGHVSINALLLVVYMGTTYRMSHLSESQIRLHRTNDFLRNHNRELVGEKEVLRQEMKKLQKMSSKQSLIEPTSRAEKIIQIMQKLKESEACNEFIKEIDFVMDTMGGGRNLYIPDMKEAIDQCSPMDSSLKSFLLSHDNNQGDRNDVLGENYEKISSEIYLNRNSFFPKADELLQRISEWDFDIFELAKVTGGQPLYYMGKALFAHHKFVEKFNIDPVKLDNFLIAVERGYQAQNPYHNNTHASDVAQTLHYIIKNAGVGKYLNDVDIFAGIVAALVHDLDHPGVNNHFEIAVGSSRALVHNDHSVLENHHLSTAFHLIQNDDCNIFSGVSRAVRKELRHTIIQAVLATDFSKHLEVLGQFKSRRATGDFDKDKPEDRLLLLKMALKCADISHTSKPSQIHFEWSKRITEEMFLQGDLERKVGLPVSAFMERETTNIPKSQSGFINFLVLPLFEVFHQEFPTFRKMYDQLESNLNHWKMEELACNNNL